MPSHPLLRMLTGPVIWTTHFAAIYALLSVGCAAGWEAMSVAGMDLIRALLLALSLPAILILVWITHDGWKRRRHWEFSGPSQAGLAVLSLLAVAWEMMAVPLQGPCL